jgi:hypothetical protein
MGRTRFLAIAASTAVMLGVGATGAFAGEIKGPPYQGDPVAGGIGDASNSTGAVTNGHASVCAFSGLNDFDSELGQNDRQTQTPKDAAPGSAAHGWTITIPGVGEVTISCNKNGPVG